MSHGNPPPPPPPPSLPPPSPAPRWPGQTEPERPKRRRWPIVLLVVVLVLGGCGAVATVVGFRVLGSMTAPVDVANEFLDAARSGGDAARHVCGGQYEPREDLATSVGQHLTGVNISNNRIATVEGTITLEGGATSGVVVRLDRSGDGWCVTSVSGP